MWYQECFIWDYLSWKLKGINVRKNTYLRTLESKHSHRHGNGQPYSQVFVRICGCVLPLGKSFYITFWSRTMKILSSLFCSHLLQDCTWIRSYGGVLLLYLYCRFCEYGLQLLDLACHKCLSSSKGLFLLYFFPSDFILPQDVRSELWIRLNQIDSGSSTNWPLATDQIPNFGNPSQPSVGALICWCGILLYSHWQISVICLKTDWNEFKID